MEHLHSDWGLWEGSDGFWLRRYVRGIWCFLDDLCFFVCFFLVLFGLFKQHYLISTLILTECFGFGKNNFSYFVLVSDALGFLFWTECFGCRTFSQNVCLF